MQTYLVTVGKRMFVVCAPNGSDAMRYTKQFTSKETERTAEPFSVAVERGATKDIHEICASK